MSGPFGPSDPGEGRNDPTQHWGADQNPGQAGPTQQWGGQQPGGQAAQPTQHWGDQTPQQQQQQWGAQQQSGGQQQWGQQSGPQQQQQWQPNTGGQQQWGQQPQQDWGQQQPQQDWGQQQQQGQQDWGQQSGQQQQWGQQPQQQWGQAGQQLPQQTPGKKKNKGLIIGLAIGGVVLIGAIVTGVLLLTAKDKLDQSAVQDGVKKVLTDSYGITDVTDVSCPSGQEVKEGATFECSLKVSGEDKKVNLKITDKDGTYEVGRPN
ncbi:DUF4333 domain-containing protein [Nocardia sp. NPDC127579]|uniref:DUF4333 domain-containing protein n=1 Tax=Nocardia sp. NPDC127579 TaxID=3345402 RepID=UPI00362EAFCA